MKIDEESQNHNHDQMVMVPLASQIRPRSDEQSQQPNTFFKPKKHQKPSKLPVYILLTIVVIFASLLAFASIVLRPTNPSLKLSSVNITKFVVGNNSTSFNGTLSAELTVKNRNFGRFRYSNSTGRVMYRGVSVGDVKIREGRVRARDVERLRVAVDVGSNGYVEMRNLSYELDSGVLNLTSSVELVGSVNLLDFLKRKRRVEMVCFMSLVLRNRSVQNLDCQ